MSSIAGIRLHGEAERQIRQLATKAYPDEGCGVLIGQVLEGGVEAVVATSGRNINRERSRDRYLLDPADIVRADREARERDLDVVGFWHSHPDHPARPSQFDTDHAWLDYVYLIVNSVRGDTGDLNGFTLQDEGGPFIALPLAVTSEAQQPR